MKEYIFFALKCLYLMLPAYFANMSPIIFKKINILNYPIDFSKTLGGKPILGKNKTFRGIFFGILCGIAAAYLQHLLYSSGAFKNLSFYSYERWILFGFLMSAGAIIGDSIKSFFKRRLDIKPGTPFIPFDQTDFVIGGLTAISGFGFLTAKIIAVSLALSLVLHILVNHFAYYTGIRNEKW